MKHFILFSVRTKLQNPNFKAQLLGEKARPASQLNPGFGIAGLVLMAIGMGL